MEKYNCDNLFMEIINKCRSYDDDNYGRVSAERFLLTVIEHLKEENDHYSLEEQKLIDLFKDTGLYDSKTGFEKIEGSLRNKLDQGSIDETDSYEYFKKIISSVISALSFDKIHIVLTTGIVKMMLTFPNDSLREITGESDRPAIPDDAWNDSYRESIENFIVRMIKIDQSIDELKAMLKELREPINDGADTSDSAKGDDKPEAAEEELYEEELYEEDDDDDEEEEEEENENVYDEFEAADRELSEEEYEKASDEFNDLIFFEHKLEKYNDVMTTADVSRFLGYSLTTITDWYEKKEIRCFQIKNKLAFPTMVSADFLQFVVTAVSRLQDLLG